jgi:hypothetical protein
MGLKIEITLCPNETQFIPKNRDLPFLFHWTQLSFPVRIHCSDGSARRVRETGIYPAEPILVFDQGQGSDILDAIVAEGRCRTCDTPWNRVVNVEGKRPVKIEGGCPNEVCVLGDW